MLNHSMRRAAGGAGDGGGDYISDGALASIDCSVLSGWTQLNIPNGQVVQTTRGGGDVFLLQATSDSTANVSRITRDIYGSATPNTFTISTRIELSALRTIAQGNLYGGPIDYWFDTGGTMRMLINVYSDYIRIRPTSGDVDISYSFATGGFVWVNCKVTWVSGVSASLDLAVDGQLLQTGIDCYRTATGGSDGHCRLAHVDQYSDLTNESMYVSDILLGNDWND